MAVLVWVMVGIALWHFAVLVPDRFWGAIIGAFLASLAGAGHRLAASDSGSVHGEPAGRRRSALGRARVCRRTGRLLRVRRAGHATPVALIGRHRRAASRWD
jgi:hypothetical protein